MDSVSTKSTFGIDGLVSLHQLYAPLSPVSLLSSVTVLTPGSPHSWFYDPALVPFSKCSNPLKPGKPQLSRERVRSDWREGRETHDRSKTWQGWTDMRVWTVLGATRI